jgi:ParB family chromosome partitioning protein
MMGRGGVKTFDALVDAVGDNSSVDGNAHAPVVAPRSGSSRSVPLRDLIGNPYNPRDSFGDLQELASIVEFQLQPVVAVSRATFQNIYPEANISARWVVIIGNRRLAAAQKFGRPELDIVVKDELAKDRATLLTAVISENVDRSGFDVIEEAKAVESLVAEYGSADAAAEHLRKSKTWVSHRRALLKLAPDLQEATRKGDLAIREARSLARVPFEQQVARWNAARDRHRPRDDANREPGEGSADSVPSDESSATPHGRSVSRALRKFDTEPNALAVALRDHLGETGAKTLMSQLRKLLK